MPRISPMDDAQRREFERVRVAVERSRIALSTRDLYDWFLILAAGAMALAALEQGRWRAAWFLAVFAAAWAADGSQSAKSIRIALARQIAVALAIAAYAGWRGFSGQPGADSLLAAGAALAFVAGKRWRTWERTTSEPAGEALLASVLASAGAHDRAAIVLRSRRRGFSEKPADYRLLFADNFAFLVKMVRAPGWRRSPRVTWFVPAPGFRIVEEESKTRAARRAPVRLTHGRDAIAGDLEVTPEMLQKARAYTLKIW